MSSYSTKGGTRYRWVLDVAPPNALHRDQRSESGFERRRDAVASLEKFKQTLLTQGPTPPQPVDTTVECYLQGWLDERTDLRPSTIRSYRQKVNHYVLTSALASQRLTEVTAPDLTHLYRDMCDRQGLKTVTITQLHAILRKAFNDAVAQGLIVTNPVRAARLPAKDVAPVIGHWDEKTLRRFLRATADHHLFALFRLVAMTGLRCGEVAGLQWGDLDIEANRLDVRQALTVLDATQCSASGTWYRLAPPKSHAGIRTIGLDEETVRVLRHHRRQQRLWARRTGVLVQDTSFVFATPLGEPYRPPSISQAFRRAIDTHQIQPITFHGLRHTHATLMLLKGMGIHELRRRLGHSSATFTLDRYSHVLSGRDTEVVELLATALAVDDRPTKKRRRRRPSPEAAA